MSNNQENLIRRTLRELLDRGHTFEDFERFDFSEEEIRSFLSGGSLGERDFLLARVVNQLTNEGEIDKKTGAIEEIPTRTSQDIHLSASDALDFKESFQATVSGPKNTDDMTTVTDVNELPPPAGVLPPAERSSVGNDKVLEELKEGRQRQINEDGEIADDQADSSDLVFAEGKHADQSVLSGLASRPTRHASREELTLDADKQANALATFFRNAVGEFCFASFGRWGRGKTFLMGLVSTFLVEQHGYKTVWFNAWKHQSTPELWAYLYHAFVSEFSKNSQEKGDGWFRKLCSHLPDCFVEFSLAFRASIYRHGIFPLGGAVVVSFLAFVRMGALLNIALLLLGAFGIVWLLYILHLMRAGGSVVTSVMNKYGRLADHREKLGAQALIGDDLKSLLIAQIPRRSFVFNFFGFNFGFKCKVAALSLIPSLFTVFLLGGVARRMEWTLFDELFLTLPGTDETRICISVVLWWGLFLAFIACVLWLPRKCKKILIIVDELDRCDPQQMLEVIESIKLLLEDPEMHERVQVAMLIQEGHLRRAIAEKFSTSNGENTFIVDEHLEKLFVSHFRLGLLNSNAIHKITDRYISHAQENTLSEMKAELQRLRPNTPERIELEDEIKSFEDNMEKPIKTFGSLAESLVKENQPNGVGDDHGNKAKEIENEKLNRNRWSYSNEEKQVLVTALESIPLKLDSPRVGDERYFDRVCEVSPRSIRAFLFKYQLSRLLLNAMGWTWDPKQLVNALMIARESKADTVKSDSQKWANVSNDIKNVVSQVI